MDDFITNKLMEDFLLGEISPKQVWKNLQECRESITDEKYDDICALITESLIDSEEIEEDDVDLEAFFAPNHTDPQLDWSDSDYEDDWTSGNDVY